MKVINLVENSQKMFQIIGTIKNVKGHCTAHHKTGDSIELSCHNANGLCGYFYHDIFPSLQTLQFGGKFPWQTDPDTLTVECPDRSNLVTMELKRIPE